MKKYIFSATKAAFLLTTLLLCACPSSPYTNYYTNSFVLFYSPYKLDTIYLRSAHNQMGPLPDDNLSYGIFIKGTGKMGIESTGAEKEIYDAVCEKHQDLTYNRNVKIYWGYDYDCRCYWDFTEFDVWSSAEWDSQHPAGSSLGDIARFVSNTPLPYIQSGYKQKHPTGGAYYPIDCLVSELKPADLTLLPASGFWLRFTHPPTKPGPHTLSIRLTTDEGVKYETKWGVVY